MSDKKDQPAAPEPAESGDTAAASEPAQGAGETAAAKSDESQPKGEKPAKKKWFAPGWPPGWPSIILAAIASVALCGATVVFVTSSGLDLKKLFGVEALTTSTPSSPAALSPDRLRVPPDIEIMPLPAEEDGIMSARYFAWDSARSAKAVWANYLQASGVKMAEVRVIVLKPESREEYKSSCKRSQPIRAVNEGSAFYCHEDHTLFVPSSALVADVWGYDAQLDPALFGPDGYHPGFAAAGVVVQTYSYAVIQALWEDDTLPEWSSENHDQLAVCFAGAWAGAFYPGLATGDIAAAVAAMRGNDPRLQRFSLEKPGDVRALEDAFTLGFRGTPAGCLEAFWKGLRPTPSASASSTLRP